VDVVCSYREREFAILEALEKLQIRPPTIPATIRHAWEVSSAKDRAEGQEEVLMISFECDEVGARYARMYGVVPVGLTANAAAAMEEEPSGTACARALLAAGCATVVQDYHGLKFDYLPYLR
jgi:hypothetical protein